MTTLPTPIISPEELASLRRPVLRLLDARSGPDAAERYRAAHLPGAVFVDLEQDLSGDKSQPERGGRHPLPSLEAWAATLGRLGIDAGTPVVVYDDQGGANAAARVWWMLRAVGHTAVAVLDGGLPAAEALGWRTESGAVGVDARPAYPVTRWERPLVSIEDVDRLRTDPAWRLIDVRASPRYRGETEPLDPVAGHIPGAHNVPLTENLDENGRFRSPAELRRRYEASLDGVPPTRTVLSCGSGVTACHTLLALERAGLSGAHLFVGSFGEWCRSGRPIATGVEP